MSFFKITPINKTLGEKIKFVFITEQQQAIEDFMFVMESRISLSYIEGAKFEKAEKDDPDFIKYLKSDLIKVNEEIIKLQNLKSEIEKELNLIK